MTHKSHQQPRCASFNCLSRARRRSAAPALASASDLRGGDRGQRKLLVRRQESGNVHLSEWHESSAPGRNGPVRGDCRAPIAWGRSIAYNIPRPSSATSTSLCSVRWITAFTRRWSWDTTRRAYLADYWPTYWFINGRTAPDTMADPGAAWLPTQPYNAFPRMHAGDMMLVRMVAADRTSIHFTLTAITHE